MGYKEALEAAGAKVKRVGHFGDSQGSWVAQVGADQFVMGQYGSCSHCDAFLEEFGDMSESHADYRWRLADFGKVYLDGAMSRDRVLAHFAKDAQWDDNAQAIAWIKQE